MKVSEGDIRGTVKLLSSSDTLAPRDESTFQKLQTKHTGPSRNLNFLGVPFNDTDSLAVTEKEDMNAILSFPNGSALGIDRMRPQHLKDMLSNFTANTGKRLLASITRLCHLMWRVKVNHAITDILYGASLCTLSKKDGGIRPIAVGSTFRRLVAKLGCAHYRDSIGEFLRPKQLGFGTKGGCETAVHCFRTFIHRNTNTPKVLLKIDFRNAFNTVERDEIPAWAAIEIINAIDRSIEVAFESISNISFGEQQWYIASLPIKCGGLGLPFAVESLGPWSNSVRNFINELEHGMMMATGDAQSKQFFIQRISLAIQRGNAASVMGTFPPSAAMEEIFLL
ncbi:hypothetical protein ILUMI_09853 [Ignelater luminosus]|uniref:Reverse transcriptase domain-containing protein n=1 Tax=Ignelater luminosus TaxID=2038154 RepID=A0A8K0GC11_IGNLU|nr:hypothetical protein ILUMI_09853 [Ignelater luminosus]